MFDIQFEPFFLVVFAAIMFGASIGSFLNVVVYRSPRECVTVNHPVKSFCPVCRRQLRWYENQPIIGWLMLRGKCGGCSLPISARYPLVEVGIAVIWVLAAYRCLESGHFYPIEAVILALTCSYFVVAALIDFDLRILPNFITIPGMILLPGAAFLAPKLHRQTYLTEILTPFRESVRVGFGVGFDIAAESWVAPLDDLLNSPFVRNWDASLGALSVSLAGMMVGAGIIWAILAGGRSVFGRPVMGFGDVKFMGFVGALLGPQDTFVALVLATVVGSAAGLLAKFLSGSSALSKSHFDFQLGPINRVLLAPFQPNKSLENGVVKLRYRGLGAVVARFVGGDSTIAFGPYLAAAALFIALCPLRWIDQGVVHLIY